LLPGDLLLGTCLRVEFAAHLFFALVDSTPKHTILLHPGLSVLPSLFVQALAHRAQHLQHLSSITKCGLACQCCMNRCHLFGHFLVVRFCRLAHPFGYFAAFVELIS
jgi:hypothetical protein